MKLLFLDFDGVLNSTQSTRMYWVQGGRECVFPDENHFCPIALSNLQFLMESVSDLHVVISSSWRLMYLFTELQGFLQSKANIDPRRVLDITPKLVRDPVTGQSMERGHEIQAWLDDNAYGPRRLFDLEDFIIVDDDSDMAHLKDTHFLQTDGDLGLTIKDVRTIVARFGGNCDGW